MQYKKVKISEEDVVISKSNMSRPTLSIKLPWYNDDNNVIGLFGCSIILGRHPLAESLSIINKIGLLNAFEDPSSHIGKEINHQYLSKRQLSCAKLLLTGMTQQEIADQSSNSNHHILAWDSISYAGFEDLINLISALPATSPKRDLYMMRCAEYFIASMAIDKKLFEHLLPLLENMPLGLKNKFFFTAFSSNLNFEVKLKIYMLLATDKLQKEANLDATLNYKDEKNYNLIDTFPPATKELMTKFFVDEICSEPKPVPLASKGADEKNEISYEEKTSKEQTIKSKNLSWSLLGAAVA